MCTPTRVLHLIVRQPTMAMTSSLYTYTVNMPLKVLAWFYSVYIVHWISKLLFVVKKDLSPNSKTVAQKKKTASPNSDIGPDGDAPPPSRPLTKYPGTDRVVVEGSLTRPEKHMVMIRGMVWEVTPPLVRTAGDSFNIMLRCVYFPSTVRWQMDVSVKVSISSILDPNSTRELKELKGKVSEEVYQIGLPFIRSFHGMNSEQWLRMNWFKVEIAVANFEGYSDPTPSQLAINFEDPSINHDRVLVIEGREIYVMSGVLSLWSSYFATLYKSSEDTKRIEVDDVSADEFIEMLQVIYPSNKPINVESLDSLLSLAHRFRIPHLTMMCRRWMQNAPKYVLDGARMQQLTNKYKCKTKNLELDVENPTVLHDRIIVIDGRRIYVQSAMLAVHSPYFASLFDAIDDHTKEIPLSDVSADEFIEMLKVIYPTEKEITDSSVASLLQLAERFEIPWLTAKCSLHLCSFRDIGMELIPLVQLVFDYELDQVKAWLFVKASRGHYGCIDRFMDEKGDELRDLSLEVQQFFRYIHQDWNNISRPTGSECHPQP